MGSSAAVTAAGVLGAALAVAGCGTGLDIGFGVATTVVFDKSVDDAALARVSALQLNVTGDESFTGLQVLPAGASRAERFIYRPLPTSRALLVDISAIDPDGAPIAAGHSAVIALSAGASASADIVLSAGSGPLYDFAGLDLTGVDLTGFPAPMDASVVDAAGGDSRCAMLTAADGVLRCYGYETSSDVVTPQTVNGVAEVDPSHHFRGASSLHLGIHAPPPSPMYTNGFAWSDAPGGSSKLYLRAFVYLPAPPTESTPLLAFTTTAYVTLVTASLGVSADGHLQATHGIHTDMGITAVTVTSTETLPIGAWTCLEVAVNGESSLLETASMQVTKNEVVVPDLLFSGAVSNMNGSYSGGRMLAQLNTATPFDVWLDEVVLATQPIGCEK